MLDKMLEKDAQAVLKVPGLRISGYVLLICGGMFVYGFSIANLRYTPVNETMRLLAELLLWSYFVVGVIVIHVCAHFFNRMIMITALTWLNILCTVGSASVYAFQTTVGYPIVRMIYSVMMIAQLIVLVLVMTKWITAAAKRKKIFLLYLGTLGLFFGITTVPPLLNGDGRWSGPDHVGWYEKNFGVEVAEMLMGPLSAILMCGMAIGAFMWGSIYIRGKYNFDRVPVKAPVSGYLFQIRRWGHDGGWGYIEKDSNDFPDSVVLL
ncbi:hypothetical protein [Halalkalibacterium halodurans]|uniref:hypothetical protein n=1 Tax=Halalkalibacterium halodurans TaxID=86665 RepID=UPI002AAA517F|nr:hypothetical protein [Halalkalibacterium halodurans]MDY7224607.1 hypothetical protein [Halalkalibacterium halodurans]MDY7240730.1 hypothetical protein [Halalkalibacterium halodurans]